MTDSTNDSSSAGARMITRWIGTGVGAAMLITVLSLTFTRLCITSAQSHVLAVVLALGAALVLWGIVGGLQIDVRLKFKALGEVAAAGVAGIFLVVHFVAADGIIASEDCTEGPDEPGVYVLHGRVHLEGAVTKSLDDVEITIDLPERIDKETTDDDGQFSAAIKGEVTRVRVWATKPGYDDSEVQEVELPLAADKLVITLKKTGTSGSLPPRPIPTPIPRPIPGSADGKPKVESGLRINSGSTDRSRIELESEKKRKKPQTTLGLLP